MPIDVEWRDETGKRLEVWRDEAEYVYWILSIAEIDGTICLRFIDLYGDTTFNQKQIPILLEELLIASSALTENNYLEFFPSTSIKPTLEDIRSNIENLIRFISKCIGKTHTYIKFIGD